MLVAVAVEDVLVEVALVVVVLVEVLVVVVLVEVFVVEVLVVVLAAKTCNPKEEMSRKDVRDLTKTIVDLIRMAPLTTLHGSIYIYHFLLGVDTSDHVRKDRNKGGNLDRNE